MGADMILTTGTGTTCGGSNNHFQLPVTLGGGAEVTLHVTREELVGEPLSNNPADSRERLICRLRSAIKETTVGVPSLAEIAAAVNNKTFEI